MDRNLFICSLFLLFLFGCNEDPKKNASIVESPNQGEASYKKVHSDGDYNFQIEYNNRLDTSYLDVIYKGKKTSRNGYPGKIENSFLADLNKDEKNEIYLEMKKESSSKLFGYFLNEGKINLITINPPKHLSNVKTSTYEAKRNQLIGLYKTMAKDQKLVTHESRFNLVKREDKYVLLPQGWTSSELQAIPGQYLSKNASTPDYYKSLIIGKREGGKYKVEIQVKRTSNRKVICEFSGIGEIIDKNIFIPLNQADPALKGTLEVRILGLLAAVYTEDKAHGQELISFCPEKGSIAGNFKKSDI